jgi:hypothetical protein
LCVLHIETSMLVHAPWERVAAIYGDYRSWPQLFPTIHGVKLVREEPGRIEVEVDHDEGIVPNVLTWLGRDTVRLDERKRLYDATFVNSFEAAGGNTRYRVAADIRLRGAYRLLAPLLRGLVRRRIERFVLAPVKARAEARS